MSQHREELVTQRAMELNCTLVQTNDSVVLVKRGDTYITWNHTLSDGKAEFYWGHYDMELGAALEDFKIRTERSKG